MNIKTVIDNKFSIGYYKSNQINIVSLEKNYTPSTNDIEFGYNPFSIDKLQQYNPIYDELFTLSKKNYNTIQLNHHKHFVNTHSVVDMSGIEHQTNMFFKYSPLLDPLRYMVGKYEDDTEFLHNLPVSTCVSNDNSNNVLSKISSPHNCSYVDTFFYYLSSMTLQNHNIINCLDFYGSFLGIQQKYKYDVSDDIDYLTESPFFNNNNNHLFTLQNVDIDQYPNDDSRKQRPKLYISKTNHNISAVSIAESLTDIDDIDNINDLTLDNCIVYENKLNVDNSKVEDSVDDGQSSYDNSSIAYTTDSDEDDESDWETTTDTSNDDSTCSIQ